MVTTMISVGQLNRDQPQEARGQNSSEDRRFDAGDCSACESKWDLQA
jgi:hypothetical protein